ncbi:hypothetical protein EW146_g6537 [Bondarzewia mesenterica]|uniref:F-box domain-containing protein n=1 Tax=Bondarzewia mesenterica TaxID=1095465 RepID=A0A4S4LN94_9AGAM|nr:hypothetical protein EW146_g6537 [Bondarzewia mesenterica]
MDSVPIEMLWNIVGGVSSQRDLLNIRAVNKIFHLLATPPAFRTVRVKNSVKSADSFKRIVTSKALMPFIKEVRFRDRYTDEDGNEIGGFNSIDSIVPDQANEGDEEFILHTLTSAFSHLFALPALDTLVLNLYPYFTERSSYEFLKPSGTLDFQLAILKALSTNSDKLSLTSFTINHLIAFHNELYDDPSFLQIFSDLSHLHLSVMSNLALDEGPPFEGPMVEFWEKTIPHRILASPAGSLAKSLTSLAIDSDRDVRISFSELTYPLLTSFSLEFVFFDDHHDINAAAATDVEDFIVRHGSTLKHLKLRCCMIPVLNDESTPRRFWSQIWSRFANELKVLECLQVWEREDVELPVVDGQKRILRYTIVEGDEGWGYMPVYEPMVGEANDGPALQALQEVVATRRQSTSRLPKLKDRLKMNSTFYHWATPLAFRTVAVENTTRSIHNFNRILDSPRQKFASQISATVTCFPALIVATVHSLNDLQSLRPREGFEELSIIDLLGKAFARLHELPMLRGVTINLNPEYDKECTTEDNTGYYPSWRYQEAMVGELRRA